MNRPHPHWVLHCVPFEPHLTHIHSGGDGRRTHAADLKTLQGPAGAIQVSRETFGSRVSRT